MLLKEKWDMNDTVYPSDLNEICKNVNYSNKNKQPGELIKLKTDNSHCIFKSEKGGFATNIKIDGLSVNNLSDMAKKDNSNPDGVIRTRINNFGDDFKFNTRISAGKYTLFNFTDKSIAFVGMDKTDNWAFGCTVEPFSRTVVDIPEDKTICGVDFQPPHGWDTQTDFNKVNKYMFMIVEGDAMDIPFAWYPPMSESINRTIINANTKGENLVTNNLTFRDNEYIECYLSSDKWGEYIPNETMSVSNEYIEVLPNEQYLFINSNANIPQYDENFVQIKNTIQHDYTVPDDRFTQGSGVFLLKTTTETKYIKIACRKEQKKHVKVYAIKDLNNTRVEIPIRSLRNGLKDTVVYENGKYYKYERIKKYIWTGLENWQDSGTNEKNPHHNNYVFYLNKLNDLGFKPGGYMETNLFKYFPDTVLNANSDFEGISFTTNTLKEYEFRVSCCKFKLNEQNATGFKELLKKYNLITFGELKEVNRIEIPNIDTVIYEGDNLFINAGTVVSLENDFDITTTDRSCIDIMKRKLSETISHSDLTQTWKLTDKQGYNIKLTENYHVNNIDKNGEYIVATDKGTPYKAWWYIKHQQSFGAGFAHQIMCDQSTIPRMFYRFQLSYKWTEWIEINTETHIRLWEGSWSATSGDIPLIDSALNYKGFIIGVGQVSEGYFTSQKIHSFAYLKEKVRAEDEFFMPLAISNSNYKLYFKPKTGDPTKLYFELRNYNNTYVGSSNPNTKAMVIRYIIGVK